MVKKKKISRYQKRELIQSGSYGRVFLAWDKKEQTRVVIKQVKAKYHSDLIKEIYFMRQLHQQCPRYFPEIKQVIYLDCKDQIQIIMKYYSWTLGDLIDHDQNNDYLLIIMQQIMEAYVIMEQNLIRHFDIKPDNILIEWLADEQPVIKVIDLGFAEYYSNQARSCVICTPGYRPIELFLHQKLNFGLEVDLWSIAVTLLDYYHKRYFFDGQEDQDTFQSILARYDQIDYNQYFRFNPDFGYVISHFLAKNKLKRWEAYLFMRPFIYTNLVEQSALSDSPSDSLPDDFQIIAEIKSNRSSVNSDIGEQLPVNLESNAPAEPIQLDDHESNSEVEHTDETETIAELNLLAEEFLIQEPVLTETLVEPNLTEFKFKAIVEIPSIEQLKTDYWALVKTGILKKIPIQKWINLLVASLEVLDELNEVYANYAVWGAFYQHFLKVVKANHSPMDEQTLYVHGCACLYTAIQIHYVEYLDEREFIYICRSNLPAIRFTVNAMLIDQLKIIKFL